MDEAQVDPWSAIAAEWQLRWGRFAAPAWDAVFRAARPRPGHRALDVGCGSGELVAHLAGIGLEVAGVDPAPGMLALARAATPGADLRVGEAARLPWDADRFDLAIAVNALHLADEAEAALVEMTRVVRPGGHVAIVSWADRELNDVDVIDRALSVDDEPVAETGPRVAEALERLLVDAGLTAVVVSLVETPWEAADDDALVRGVLLGEDPATAAAEASTVVTAAVPFCRGDGSYRLVNHLQVAVGCVAG